MTTLLLVSHDPAVTAGHLDAPIRARCEVLDVDATSGDFPDAAPDETAVLLLGGKPSTTEPPDWMQREFEWVADLVQREVPVMGLCLGAQILGQALGGEVVRRAQPETHIIPLHRTVPGQDDPIAAGWPDGAPLLFFHHDEVIRLPTGADQLLSGSDGPSLWRSGSAYACQAHPEAGLDEVTAWLQTDGGTDPADAGVDPDELLAEVAAREAFLRAGGASLVLRWLDEVLTDQR